MISENFIAQLYKRFPKKNIEKTKINNNSKKIINNSNYSNNMIYSIDKKDNYNYLKHIIILSLVFILIYYIGLYIKYKN